MTDLLQIAQLGVEAEAFKSTNLGRYLFQKADDEIIEALHELARVDPTNVKRITELQNQSYRANSFMTWIDEAIESGNFAIDELQTE